jgi:hypothetical protein
MQHIPGSFGIRDKREIPGMLVALFVILPGICVSGIVRDV